MGVQFFIQIMPDGISYDYLATTPLNGEAGDFAFSDITSSGSAFDENNPPYELTEGANVSAIGPAEDDYNLSSTGPERDEFIIIDPPGLIVGENVNDDVTSLTEFAVGQGNGEIVGGNSADRLVGDFGGATLEGQTQNCNIVFILDVSGSMGAQAVTGETRLELMVRSVNELMQSFSEFQGGEINVHITAFNNGEAASGTFTVTDAQGYTDATALMNSLQQGGFTNYEAGLQNAIDFMQGSNFNNNAMTTTYFLSDGKPNYAVDDATGDFIDARSGPLSAMGHILGEDGSNEVETIQNLSDEVIGVGISITDGAIANIDIIDSDGDALNVPADKLVATMKETNPLLKLAAAGDDVIYGNEEGDLIFGDVLNTDILAQTHGITTDPGAGWEVFVQLEGGQSVIQPIWNRGNSKDYITLNAEELAQESVAEDGTGRIGGNDYLDGGSGNDIIFGQEGDDQIVGGTGSDTLYGGSGEDIFIYNSADEGGDIIKDFSVSEGDALDLSSLLTDFDPIQDDINDFITLTESNGNTDVNFNSTRLATLEGVDGLDLTQLVTDGQIIV